MKVLVLSFATLWHSSLCFTPSSTFRTAKASINVVNKRILVVGLHNIRMEDQGPSIFGVSPEKIPDIFSASLASLARLGTGAFISGYRAELNLEYSNPTLQLPIKEFTDALPSIRPKKPLELYEFEACPFCRKVREALSMLDLDAVVYPCPRGGSRFRPTVIAKGGKAQFPYFEDPNTGFAAYESDDIVRYLFQTYGDGVVPLELSLGPLTLASSAIATALRPGKGREAASPTTVTATFSPPTSAIKPLELWGYEASPYCRLVRERLCELEVPYRSVTTARGSPKRELLRADAGKFQVPYLRDPNTATAMFESADILTYLDLRYGPAAAAAAAAAAAEPADAVKVEAELVG